MLCLPSRLYFGEQPVRLHTGAPNVPACIHHISFKYLHCAKGWVDSGEHRLLGQDGGGDRIPV